MSSRSHVEENTKLAGTDNGESCSYSSASVIPITRPIYTIGKKRKLLLYSDDARKSNDEERLSKKKTSHSLLATIWLFLLTRVPLLQWLPSYKVKHYLSGDILAGITVAVMHIPQGMAYALLAGMSPICGIYTAFFPVLIYVLFTTSHHCSMGTFAVVSLMVADVVKIYSKLEDDSIPNTNATMQVDELPLANATEYTPTEVVVVVTLAVAFWETYIDIIKELTGANFVTLVVSFVCIIVLVFNNEILKPVVRRHTRIPIPIELMTVVGGTVASYFIGLNRNYNVKVVGEVPVGLPHPALPPFELFDKVLLDSLAVAIVSYSVSFSMAKIFAKRQHYKVNANQELFAMSLGNLCGSFFLSLPISASLSRSLLQEAVGGVRQVASLVSCSLLLMVLLFLGPVFEFLPSCVLSAIIVVALKGMFVQVFDMVAMWKVSRKDALIWLITFLVVVIVDIDIGLIAGLIFSVIILLVQYQKPKVSRIGRIMDTDIYLHLTAYSLSVDNPELCMCSLSGSLHFANCEFLRDLIIQKTKLDPRELLVLKKSKAHCGKSDNLQSGVKKSEQKKEEREARHSLVLEDSLLPDLPKWILLDFSGVDFIDVSAAKMISNLYEEYAEFHIILCVSGCSDHVYDNFYQYGLFDVMPERLFFHSIHDAYSALTSYKEESTESNCL